MTVEVIQLLLIINSLSILNNKTLNCVCDPSIRSVVLVLIGYYIYTNCMGLDHTHNTQRSIISESKPREQQPWKSADTFHIHP